MKSSIQIGTAAACLFIMSFGVSIQAQQEGATNSNSAASAQAAGTVVPRLVRFSGAVTDATGKPALGAVQITFSLYTLPEGGTPLWTETQHVDLDRQGHYTVFLGAASPDGLPLDLFASGEARWLGVTPDLPGMGEQPRALLVGVPYALKAADADTLGGLPASAFMQVAPSAVSTTVSGAAKGASKSPKSTSDTSAYSTIVGAGLPSFVPLWTGDYTIQNSTLFQSGSNLGVGTTTPAATLDVNGTTKFEGLATFAPGQTFPTTNVLPADPTTHVSGYVIPDSSTYYYYFFQNQKPTDTITLPHATERGEVIAIAATNPVPGMPSFNIQAESGDKIWVPGVQFQISIPIFGVAALVSDGQRDWYVQTPSSFPDLTITKTHTGNFQAGSTGTYTIAVSNAGGLATNGLVTVTDTLPAGLTATAFSGPGWNCTLSSLTCTRSDALGTGASYPALTLTVSVGQTVIGTVTNVANVSGGSEVNNTNDRASDPTTVNGLPILQIQMQQNGTFYLNQQGTYTITITNAGDIATNGSLNFSPSFPGSFSLNSWGGGGWQCPRGTFACNYPPALAAGASTTLTYTVTPTETGTFTVSGTVSGGGSAPATASIQTTVEQ